MNINLKLLNKIDIERTKFSSLGANNKNKLKLKIKNENCNLEMKLRKGITKRDFIKEELEKKINLN